MRRACPIRSRSPLLSRWVLVCLAAPGIAFAHPELHVSAGIWAGFLHPLIGIDHLLVMVAVGWWAVRLGPVALGALPMAFPLAMVAGAAVAQAGVSLPLIEPMIGLSVLLIGIAVAVGLQLSLPLSATLIGFFAVFHGYAHAIEAPTQGSLLSYGIGFIVATVLLHLIGVFGGGMLVHGRHDGAMRIGGSLIAMTGAALLIF